MSIYRELPWREFLSSLTVGDHILTTERLTGRREGHTIECTGSEPWRHDQWLQVPGFIPAGARLMPLNWERIGFYQSYMHRHNEEVRFFFDVFSLRGAHIASLGEAYLHQLALGTDILWIIRRAGDGDVPGFSIEGVDLQTGDRIGPRTITAQLIQTLGTSISQRRWSEVYRANVSSWGLNWQGDHPWLTIQVLRPGKRPVRKRYHLPLEAALVHLAQSQP